MMKTQFPALPETKTQQSDRWHRYEPRSRSHDPNLAAPTADPLWLLGRQWQIGELKAEDAGSPVTVSFQHDIWSVNTVIPETGTTTGPRSDAPLEVLVEREIERELPNPAQTPLEPPPGDLVRRVRIGQQFERFLRDRATDGATLITHLRQKLGLTAPSARDLTGFHNDARRFVQFMQGRVIDSDRLTSARTELPNVSFDAPNIPPLAASAQWPALSSEEVAFVLGALEDLDQWAVQVLYEPTTKEPTHWKNTQLHYQFGAKNETSAAPLVLAPNYRNGDLDWYAFELANNALSDTDPQEGKFVTRLATRVDFGRQTPRWWTFGDKQLNFSRVEPETTELGKVLFTDFIVKYSDDWFSLNLNVPRGSIAQIKNFQITDVFSVKTPASPARHDGTGPRNRFEMFSMGHYNDPTRAGTSVLFVPEVSGYRLESDPLEEVRFARDEGANLVWGIERTVRDMLGLPNEGFEAQRHRWAARLQLDIASCKADRDNALEDSQDPNLSEAERQQRAQDAANKQSEIDALESLLHPKLSSGTPVYRLSNTVPENWIPFLPYNINDFENRSHGSIALRRARMWRSLDSKEAEDISGATRILSLARSDSIRWLEEEAVPRAGIRLLVTKQRVRDANGKTFVWIGRKVMTGRGEENSGLRFDFSE